MKPYLLAAAIVISLGLADYVFDISLHHFATYLGAK